jgi:WD40 repeat protein
MCGRRGAKILVMLLAGAAVTGCPRDSTPPRNVSPTAAAILPKTPPATTAPPTPLSPPRLTAASVDELPPHASARFGTLRLNHSPLPFALAFSPDDAYLASCGSGAKIQIWDRRTGDNVRTFTAPAAATAIAWRSSGYQLVTISHNGSVITWDVTNSTELHHFTIARAPNSPVAIAASGRVAFFDAAGILQVVDSDDGHAITSLGPKVERTSERSERGEQAHVEQLDFARNGETLLSQTVRGVIHLHTIKSLPATQPPPTTMQTGRNYSATAAVSDDGSLVAVDLGHSGLATIAIFDAATGQEIRRFDAGTSTATGLAFSPNQASLHVELFGGDVSHWSIDGKLLGNYNEQHRGQRLLTRSSDGAWLATAGPSSTIRLWDTSTKQSPNCANAAMTVRSSLLHLQTKTPT